MLKAQKILAEELVRLRNAAGLSQGDVAERLGYSSPQFVSNWERGMSTPPIKELKQLAQMYSISAIVLKNLVVARGIEAVTFKIEQEFIKS